MSCLSLFTQVPGVADPTCGFFTMRRVTASPDPRIENAPPVTIRAGLFHNLVAGVGVAPLTRFLLVVDGFGKRALRERVHHVMKYVKPPMKKLGRLEG